MYGSYPRCTHLSALGAFLIEDARVFLAGRSEVGVLAAKDRLLVIMPGDCGVLSPPREWRWMVLISGLAAARTAARVRLALDGVFSGVSEETWRDWERVRGGEKTKGRTGVSAVSASRSSMEGNTNISRDFSGKGGKKSQQMELTGISTAVYSHGLWEGEFGPLHWKKGDILSETPEEIFVPQFKAQDSPKSSSDASEVVSGEDSRDDPRCPPLFGRSLDICGLDFSGARVSSVSVWLEVTLSVSVGLREREWRRLRDLDFGAGGGVEAKLDERPMSLGVWEIRDDFLVERRTLFISSGICNLKAMEIM